MLIRRQISVCARFILVFSVASCTPAIAPFSQQAYLYATELKVESLKLMDMAETPFQENLNRVDKLLTQLDKAYEFAKGRPRNEHSTLQWEILLNADRNLFGGFLKRWELEGTLSYPFIRESRLLVSDAFDTVIGLESGKLRFDN